MENHIEFLKFLDKSNVSYKMDEEIRCILRMLLIHFRFIDIMQIALENNKSVPDH